jgi:hypothetical protein
VGKPRLRWMDGVDSYQRTTVERWTTITKDRGEWRRIVTDARALHAS